VDASVKSQLSHKTQWATWSQLNFAPCSWSPGVDCIC
jgi:hypothetical protein